MGEEHGHGSRGVPRSAGMDHGHGNGRDHGDDHDRDGGGHDPPAMQRSYDLRTLWIPLTVLLLGAWLASSPFTFGYVQHAADVPERVLQVTELRDLAPVDERARDMVVSDVASGLLLIVLSLLSLKPGRVWSRWAMAIVGAWLLFAPLVLWSPSAAAYAMNTAIGTLVIGLVVMVPMMPGMMLVMKPGPEVPPGWSYNPSSWHQRTPLIVLAWVSYLAARYMSAYQLGYIDSVPDPFFGSGTERVLDSDVSLAFPVSDAGLGAAAITIEALMGYMGSTHRWRTMPWMVSFFGVLVIPVGVVHVALVILQPVSVGTWCTLCIVAAGSMLVMVPLALDEVVAMGQLIRRRIREGDAFWSVFIKGGTVEGGGTDERSPHYGAAAREHVAAGLWGATLPWNLAVSIALGVWIMAAPDVIGISGAMADASRLLGATIVTVAVVATAELARAFRLLNVVAGLALAAAPLVLAGSLGAEHAGIIVPAIAVAAASVPRGTVRQAYGGAGRYIR